MNQLYPVVIFLMVMAAGCKRKEVEGPQGPAGPAGPAYKGVVTGHVWMYDQNGSKLVYNYVPLPVVLAGYDTVMTDSVGYFHFDSVVTGTYKMSVSGEGFGATVVRNVNVIKDTLYQPVKISQKPAFEINSFEASRLNATAEVQLTATLPVDTRPRNILILVGKTPSVSGDPSTYLFSYVKSVSVNSLGMVNIKIPAGDLNNARIFYGEVVYFAAYSYVQNDMSVYEDPVTGRNYYTAVGARVVDSCFAP